jgi:hypothetical protein
MDEVVTMIFKYKERTSKACKEKTFVGTYQQMEELHPGVIILSASLYHEE